MTERPPAVGRRLRDSWRLARRRLSRVTGRHGRAAALLAAGAAAVALAALGGAGARLATGTSAETSRHVSFVVVPSTGLSQGQVPDATRGLGDSTGSVLNTISGVLSSRWLLESSIAEARPGFPAASYSTGADVRPGSTIVDVALTGRSAAAIQAVEPAFVAAATSWVSRTYRAYRLEYLGGEAATTTGSDTGQVVALGALVGAAAGLALLLAVRRGVTARRDSPAMLLRTAGGVPTGVVTDTSASLERIEAILAAHLEPGERVERAGPGALRVVSDGHARRAGYVHRAR